MKKQQHSMNNETVLIEVDVDSGCPDEMELAILHDEAVVEVKSAGVCCPGFLRKDTWEPSRVCLENFRRFVPPVRTF